MDLRTLFGQMLGQSPLDEEEFAKLQRLQRLLYYPVPRSFFDEKLKRDPSAVMGPNPIMDMPPTHNNFHDGMNRIFQKQEKKSNINKNLHDNLEGIIGKPLTPEQKRWLFDRLVNQSEFRAYDEQRKRPQDL